MNINNVIERLKSSGVTLTPQRIAIVEYLIKSKTHPTVDDIYNTIKKKYPTMSKATVYSTLRLLVELGEVKELSIRKRGEACFDPMTELHHHLLCRKCGKVIDIEFDCPENCPIITASKIQGCEVDEVQAYLYGLCPKCVKKNNQEEK